MKTSSTELDQRLGRTGYPTKTLNEMFVREELLANREERRQAEEIGTRHSARKGENFPLYTYPRRWRRVFSN